MWPLLSHFYVIGDVDGSAGGRASDKVAIREVAIEGKTTFSSCDYTKFVKEELNHGLLFNIL